MIATVIKMVGIAPAAGQFRERLGAELFVKYLVAQRLRRIYVSVRLRQAHLKRAGPNVDDSVRHAESGNLNQWQCCVRQFCLRLSRTWPGRPDKPPRPHPGGGGREARSPSTSPWPARRSAAQTIASWSSLLGTRFANPRHRVQLKSMPDQFITKFIGNQLLQAFDLFITELDYTARLQVNQMVVMRTRHLFVAGAAIAEIMPSKDISLLEEPDCAIYSCNADASVNRSCPAVDLLDVRMIDGFREHTRDDPPLLGH